MIIAVVFAKNSIYAVFKPVQENLKLQWDLNPFASFLSVLSILFTTGE